VGAIIEQQRNHGEINRKYQANCYDRRNLTTANAYKTTSNDG